MDYPSELSRGLVLVKWWLLALPHYLVVALFAGGAWYGMQWGGAIAVLVLFAVVALLFTGSYPRGIFDFVLGMNRWTLRVAGIRRPHDRRLSAVPARHGPDGT